MDQSVSSETHFLSLKLQVKPNRSFPGRRGAIQAETAATKRYAALFDGGRETWQGNMQWHATPSRNLAPRFFVRTEGPANGVHELSTVDRFLQDGFHSHVVCFTRLQIRKAADEDHFGRVITLEQATTCREILQQKNSIHHRHADIGNNYVHLMVPQNL